MPSSHDSLFRDPESNRQYPEYELQPVPDRATSSTKEVKSATTTDVNVILYAVRHSLTFSHQRLNLLLFISFGLTGVHRLRFPLLCRHVPHVHVSFSPACCSTLRELDWFPKASVKFLCDIKLDCTCHKLVPLGILDPVLCSDITQEELYNCQFTGYDVFDFRDVVTTQATHRAQSSSSVLSRNSH